MARSPNAEEFYGNTNGITQAVLPAQRSPSEEAYLQNLQLQNRTQDTQQGLRAQAIQSNVEREKSFGDSMSKAIENTPKAYSDMRQSSQANRLNDEMGEQKARASNEQSEEHGMNMKMKQLELEQKAKFGDQKAAAELESLKAGTESSKAGAESTKFSTERGRALLPAEQTQLALQNKQMGAQIENAPLVRQQLAADVKKLGLENDSIEQQNNTNNVAAIIANARSQARSPQEAEQLAQQSISRIKETGRYDDVTIQKGAALATETGMKNTLVHQTILQNDPQFQQAQEFTKRMKSSANIMASLKSELSKLEKDNSLWDSPAQKQALENIASQLDAAGQAKLANNLRQSTIEAFMTGGSPTTKLERAKQAVQAVSQSIKNELGTAASMAGSNPHLSPQSLQPIWQAVDYNPNQPLAAPSIFQNQGAAGMGMNIINTGAQPGPGVGPGQFITAPGMAMPGQQQQAAPPVDLFGLPGAQRKAMPVPPPKGK